MIKQAINTFTEGINKDLALSVLPKSVYTDAINMRVLTQSGSTSGALENVIGNEFSFKLPSLTTVWKIDALSLLFNNYELELVTDSGVYTTTMYPTIDAIVAWLTSAFGTNLFYKTNNEGGVIFYLNINISSIKVTNLGTGAVTTIGTQLTSAIVKPIPIGYVRVRDYNYIFSTDQNNYGSGQIWKISNITNTTTPQLLYNNNLNFSTSHLIPQTGVVGRYENDGTIHIYWTDNNNQLRSCNVADPDLFGLEPSQFNLVPSVDLISPILDNIIPTGSIRTGCYNIAYKLKNNFGDESQLSGLTSNIFILDESPIWASGELSNDVVGTSTMGNTVSQTIKFSIPYTDSTYNLISIYIFYRDSITGAVKVYHAYDDNLPSNGGLFNGQISQDLTDYITVTIDEATQSNTAFLQAKTIAAKDDTLFAANTRTDAFDLNWDARAYRWNRNTVSSYITPDFTKPDWGIPIDADAINPFNTDFDDTPGLQYKHQIPVPIGQYGASLLPNSSRLGGNGPNVIYEFDIFGNAAGSAYNDDHSGGHRPGIKKIGGSFSLDQSNPVANNYGDFVATFKDTHITGNFKGYARGDTYRFGVVFFDNTGNRSFVKWIADIKFPEASDGFPLQYHSSSGVSTIQVGLRIKMDISTIADQISGYRFVRVKRTENDKSRLGMGYWHPNIITKGAASDMYVYPNISHLADGANSKQFNYGSNGDELTLISDSHKAGSRHTGTMQVPDWLFNTSPTATTNDRLRFVTNLRSAGATFLPWVGGSSNHNGLSCKYYGATAYPAITGFITSIGTPKRESRVQAIVDIPFIQVGGTVTVSAGTFTNHIGYNDTNSGDGVDNGCTGAKTTYIEVDYNTAVFDYTGYRLNKMVNVPLVNTFTGGYWDFPEEIPVFSYIRPRSYYYGGDDFITRTNNEYIPCSPIFSVSDTQTTTDCIVYWGDVYTSLFDTFKTYISNQQYFSTTVSEDKATFSLIFPIETQYNIDLRYGATLAHYAEFNDNASPVATSGSVTNTFTAVEDYNCNRFYDIENEVITYIPKPFNFIANEIHDCRIWFSDRKTNGELIDNWRVFRPGKYHDTDYQFGPITSILNHNNKLYTIQENGIAFISVNEKVVIPDVASLVLGSGEGIQRHDYLTNSIGTRHQQSVMLTPEHVYFYDAKHKTIMRFGAQELSPVSDLKGLYNHFNTTLIDSINTQDNPLTGYGIACGYDFKFNEVIYTFKDSNNAFTVVYNTLTNSFTSFYSINPYMYMWSDDKLWSTTNSTINEFYEHNTGNRGEWYGSYYDSYIEFVANDSYNYSKVFDNLSIMHETYINDVDDLTTFKDVQFLNTYQDTGVIPFTVNNNIKQRERTWRLAIPRNASSTDRIRDKYIKVGLTWENDSRNRTLILHDVATSYRVSPR